MMPNNPLQVVLNSNDYQVLPERNGGGSIKDFYKGRDAAFATHRERLLSHLDSIGSRFSQPDSPALEYVHVVLEQDAWAKTKRPTTKVIPPSEVPIVGGSQLGDMIVELTPENIEVVRASISSAETEVRLVPRKDDPSKLEPKPSKQRGEVGAIREIRAHSASDRRSFSAQDAVEWLRDPRTGGSYIVETFIDPRHTQTGAGHARRDRALSEFEQFLLRLSRLELPIRIEDTGNRWRTVRLLLVKLETFDASSHDRLLRYLDQQSIVRRVTLPPILSVEHAPPGEVRGAASIAPPLPDSSYPVVGIVDTGAAPLPPLESWCAGRVDLFAGSLQDRGHGTFIAGLATAAASFNTHPVFGELPCRFYDFGLHPTEEGVYGDYFPRGFIDFLEQLDAEIPAAKEHGARVFNMSLSVQRQVADDGYGEYAAIVDEISDRHDIVFVLPAGNLSQIAWRNAWPDSGTDAAQMLAGYRHSGSDRVFQPADSVRSICVGALDPPDGTDKLRPSVYTRRGPGTALGVKPDMAHIGGGHLTGSELFSIDVAGNLTAGMGTSYAAPLAAKTLAVVDHLIEGEVTRETLMGLMVHHCAIPSPLDAPECSTYASDFVGHGMPALASDMLLTDDHSITLAFVGNLQASRELVFPFTWPASLVGEGGACRGRAMLTLAYRAPTDRRFGAEYVRANLDAYLRQEHIDTQTGEVSWKGQLKAEGKIYERHLIEHGHKWWPIKKYDETIQRGRGNSSQWRLVVDSVCRLDTSFPDDGIPFAVILTIQDPRRESAIFDELRQTLSASGARITDIRTAQRILARS